MEKTYLDYLDIMNLFGCGKDRARAIIRSIKAKSDTLKLKGKVTRVDFEVWYNEPLKKDNAAIANDSIA